MTWEDLLKADADAYSQALRHKKKVHHEDNLQIQCVRWMELQYPQWAQLLHHSPNGGARSKVEGAVFKKMGVRAGFPDLFLFVPRPLPPDPLPEAGDDMGEKAKADKGNNTPTLGRGQGAGSYHGLAIEMKTHNRNSRQSPEQKRWERMLTEQGYLYKVCRDFEEFQTIINQYLQQ